MVKVVNWIRITFLLFGEFVDVFVVTLKNESSRTWVPVFFALSIFLTPFLILSSLDSHMKFRVRVIEGKWESLWLTWSPSLWPCTQQCLPHLARSTWDQWWPGQWRLGWWRVRAPLWTSSSPAPCTYPCRSSRVSSRCLCDRGPFRRLVSDLYLGSCRSSRSPWVYTSRRTKICLLICIFLFILNVFFWVV